MAFYVGGVNYLTKMTTDIRFLPAPSQQDPLLLHWFGEQLPWVLANDGQLQAACLPAAAMEALRARSEADGAHAASVAMLARAQKALLEEGARNGTLAAPTALLKFATPEGLGDETVDAGARWQWAALQTLLYGSECYRALLIALPSWFKHRELESAAMVVQQHYRHRLSLRLVRVRRQAIERQRNIDDVMRTKRQFRAAVLVQVHWRRFVIRQRLRLASQEQQLAFVKKRTEHQLEAERAKLMRDQKAKEEYAAFCIQNRFKVLQAKKAVRAKKADANLRTSTATTLFAQTQGVALLEKVLTRHRASNSVMWETFSIVCLTYEVAQLEAMEEQLHGTKFYAALQSRLLGAEREQVCE